MDILRLVELLLADVPRQCWVQGFGAYKLGGRPPSNSDMREGSWGLYYNMFQYMQVLTYILLVYHYCSMGVHLIYEESPQHEYGNRMGAATFSLLLGLVLGG